jgi:hypothetical protein
MAKQIEKLLKNEEAMPVTTDSASRSRALRSDLGLTTRLTVTATDVNPRRSQLVAPMASGQPPWTRAANADGETLEKLKGWSGKSFL